MKETNVITKSPVFLSVVIPAYNEERRLESSLHQVAGFLATKNYKSEVIVVDDGCQDRTVAVANGLIPLFADKGIMLRVISNPGNRGKGYSVRNGMLQTEGQIALFTDADLSAPIQEIDRLIAPIIKDESDIVFGSRGLNESDIFTHQSIVRETAGRTFNLLMRTIVGLPYKDTQCGFKAFNRHRTRRIFEQQRIFGFGFDVEILFIAQKHGLRLQEMPIKWGHVEGSKVGLFSDSSRMFWDLLTIRWNYLCHRYSTTSAQAKANALTLP